MLMFPAPLDLFSLMLISEMNFSAIFFSFPMEQKYQKKYCCCNQTFLLKPNIQPTNNVADETQMVKSRGRSLGSHEPSHNTHTPKHSGPIDADREGRVEVRRVTEKVRERQKHRDKGRERKKGVEHAVD